MILGGGGVPERAGWDTVYAVKRQVNIVKNDPPKKNQNSV